MKLLVIVLCLLSERFLVNTALHHRYKWFAVYVNAVDKGFSKIAWLYFPGIILSVALLPVLGMVFCALYYFSNDLFGVTGVILNVFILYCCIGPGNPFYPAHVYVSEKVSRDKIEKYLVQVNEQLFAVLFWYIILGPLGALTYRLISQSRHQKSLHYIASLLTNILDWLPAKMTVLLYLLVGNFQAGLRDFSKMLFKPPVNNPELIAVCGLQALEADGADTIMMAQAENLVEHAVILLLVLLAVFTLAAWM